jgi:hypothetical protein
MDIRYTGKHHWTRTELDDEGKFKRMINVAPGEVFTIEKDGADRLLAGPASLRLFREAGSSEDPESDDYVRTRDLGDGGMYVSQDPGLEMGSTVQGGRTITRTEDDNPENYPIAATNEGPQSDNEALVQEDEIQAEAEEARRKARESRSRSGSGGRSTDKPQPDSRRQPGNTGAASTTGDRSRSEG